MSSRILPAILGACITCHCFAVFAQDEAVGPPEVLQYPFAADSQAPTALAGPALRKAIEDAADLGLCEKLMTTDGHEFPGGFKAEDCTAPYASKVRNGEGLVHWRSQDSRPLKCGSACVGRPFSTGTRYVDRPNLREVMLYGHLDFIIDGPFDRDLTYFYEVHAQCKAPNGARVGEFEVKIDIGQPVIGGSGVAESILDFFAMPAQISRRFESSIRAQLSPIAGETLPLDFPCRSIGAELGTTALFDAVSSDPAGAVVGHPRPEGVVGALGERAKVEFLAITRKPLSPPIPPEHAQPGNPGAGYFAVYLNGAAVVFPPPLGQPDGLMLPPAGGTVPLNYCRTVSLEGSDRLQLLFVNGLGGTVWSQFPRNAKFGADVPRRITTQRGIVIPPLGQATKPQSVNLREFELLYRITYVPEPVVVSRGGDGGRPPLSDVTDVTGDRQVLSDGSPPATPCREI